MRKLKHAALALVMLTVLTGAGPGGKGRGGPRGGAGGGAQVEPAIVPAYLFNIILGRPDAVSVTASVLAWKDMEAFISYGPAPDGMPLRTPAVKLSAGVPHSFLVDKLKPDIECSYQLTYRLPGAEPVLDEVRHFHTQRAPQATFTFALQADSHLDLGTDVRVYQKTLANMAADRPDFLVDLGDTTMVDKFGSFYTRAASQYLAQRYYLGQVAHSLPVLLTLGNHDGEQGARLTGRPGSMPLWSVGMRKKYFPNPEPGGIYTGNATPEQDAGLLQDYYAWEWGSALFVVLDPFWYTRQRHGEDNWSMTLGEAQYRWLAATLERSRAPFKFVFTHHLVGGLGRDVRGGVAAAPYMEWGGRNADGTGGFSQHRPGWAMPIHQLLVKNGVSIVFHGHDHLFAKEDLDGLVYQEVPQPGHPSGGTRSAEEYGYTGVIMGSSGHLRVTVGPRQTTVEYVRAAVPGITRDEVTNLAVDYRYLIAPSVTK